MNNASNVEKAYKNYLKMEGQYTRRNEEKMTASAASAGGNGLLSPRRARKTADDNSQNNKDPMQSVYAAVKAIRNRKI